MLRTTNKQVKLSLTNHILENFVYDDQAPLDNLVHQLDSLRYGNKSIYQAAIDYVEGGSLLVYYDSQRKFLQELLEETDQEANRYPDDKVFKLYCHLVARTMNQLYDARIKELHILA